MVAEGTSARRFQLVLIKPSHYDDDGYVIQWMRSSIPANSLACVYALAADAAERRVLGADVDIDITAVDETNTRVKVDEIVTRMARHGGFGMVGLVGVQSNQFPRAMDIARPLRAEGVPVVIGGFHVSGLLAMLPEMPADLQEALDLGCSLFAGEAEGRIDRVLADAAARTLAPIYNYMDDLPGLESAPVPFLPRETVGRVFDHHASFDAGRGCPFQCSFCTIINVQGRKSRRRSPDDVEALIRRHWEHGIKRFFITDDNFARNRDWEAIFDRIIKIREEERIDVRLIIQVDTLCHKIENFIEKARRAGVTRVFIGLENINPANLMAANKRQNKITEYRKMLLAWKQAGVITYAGYILGFPADTPDSIRADIEIIKRELPLDILEFFFLTPLPGSEDHKALWLKGVAMDPDMNKYDLEHVTTAHPQMSRAEWEAIYREAWETYYTPEHALTIFRRGAATGMGLSRLLAVLFVFSAALRIEKVHPLQVGGFRLKVRRDRRPGFPIEAAWSFYPKYLWEIVSKHARLTRHWIDLDLMRRKAKREQAVRPYTDLALTPVTDEETETLEIFTHSEDARRGVAHIRKVDALTHRPPQPPQPHTVAAE
ncbi:MAG: radical SAM protein [Rhodoplanes sp.]|uniref:B12-binding domain-containing radical SAM protein n=1 Tax=Rhodoplanes sp. TaxID=1968906 RepID=UPI00181B8332|nr:radical SAM protein [Rhodoplanes sp.]NVO13198.1 radical SAM protein [Rhodoplanes sp.]